MFSRQQSDCLPVVCSGLLVERGREREEIGKATIEKSEAVEAPRGQLGVGGGGWGLCKVGMGGGTVYITPLLFLSLSLDSIGFFDQPINCRAVGGNYSTGLMFYRQ